MEHDFSNLGLNPKKVFGDGLVDGSGKMLRVRITRDVSSDFYLDLTINMSIFDLSALVQVALDNGYLLVVLGYGDKSISK